MSTIELKKKLIKRIQSTENVELLKNASRLMEIEINAIETPFQLSIAMNEAIDTAKKQIANGEYLTHEQANKEIKEWFEK